MKAMLVLDDGRTFTGTAFGAVGETLGEAVFSTGMSGYQVPVHCATTKVCCLEIHGM